MLGQVWAGEARSLEDKIRSDQGQVILRSGLFSSGQGDQVRSCQASSDQV